MQELARNLVEEARSRGITLRLLGSIAVRELCAGREDVLARLDREPPIDIDLIGYMKQYAAISQMFRELQYQIDPTIAQSQEWGIKRLIYYEPETHAKVDIFLDVLRMSHTIDFKNRLASTSVTVAPVDLLLAKLQVFQITEKDLKDTAALLLVHELGASSQAIDVQYLVARLREDWGLYYTASKNLDMLGKWLESQHGLTTEELASVRSRLSEIKGRAEREPKSMRWRMRAAIGPRLPWYEEVGEVER
jgi:hypothetical protein